MVGDVKLSDCIDSVNIGYYIDNCIIKITLDGYVSSALFLHDSQIESEPLNSARSYFQGAINQNVFMAALVFPKFNSTLGRKY
jgi:hypothetical protein